MNKSGFKERFCAKVDGIINEKNIHKIIPEFISGSSTKSNKKQPAWKMLKQVQQLSDFITTQGFTLIELLVVVLIIGILAAVALPQYNKAVEKSRITEALVTLDAIHKALEVCALEYGAGACNIGTDGLLPLDKLHIELPCSTGTDGEGGVTGCIGKDFVFVSDISGPMAYRRVWADPSDPVFGGYAYSLTKVYGPGSADHGKFQCYVSPSNDFGEKVCTSLCGSSACYF